MIIDSRAYARAGLLGNPSDGYFGKTISVSVKNFGAHISLYHTPKLKIEPHPQDLNVYRNIYELIDSINLTGYYGGDRLIKAAIKKLCEYCEENNIKTDNKNYTVRYHSSIPRQVGLAGSSAIITATIRGLMKFYEIDIKKEILPNIVLSAEIDELGINAGLQDRVIQSYEGCVYMDFNREHMEKHGYGRYIRIDPKLLPNLYIAYKTDLGKVSGKVFGNIKSRYEKGESKVIKTLQRIGELANEGKKALENGDVDMLNNLINENFDLRCRIFNVSDNNKKMVKTARSCGASAKFTGSGGAIIGIYKDDETLNKLIVEMKKINARVIKPYVI